MIWDTCNQKWQEYTKLMKISVAVRKVSQHVCPPLCLKTSYLSIALHNYSLPGLYCCILVIYCYRKQYGGERRKEACRKNYKVEF